MKSVETTETILRHAIEAALLAESQRAATRFVPPQNSRKYGCSIANCERPAHSRGMCNAHYIRARKGMDMFAPVRARKRDDLCAECGKPTGAKGGWGFCQSHYRAARYVAIKDALIAAMGGKCSRCGGSFHRAVFDFHHCSTRKTEHPSSMLVNRSAEAVANELAGCVLLCANCHREVHSDEPSL